MASNPYRPYYVPRDGSPIIEEELVAIDRLPSREVLLALVQTYATEYFGVLVAQPLENAKLLLQVTDRVDRAAATEDESEDNDPDYFAEQTVSSDTRATDRRGYVVPNAKDPATLPEWQLSSITTLTDTISAVWERDGLFGVLKATNLTFAHNVLREAMEGYLVGMISALVSIPDPTLALDPYDGVSLGVSLLATCSTALLLAPLDCARVRSVLLPSHRRSEPLRQGFRIPSSLILPTLLDRASSVSLSYLLSPIYEPLASLAQLVVRLPIETVLRRAQAHYVTRGKAEKSIVPLAAYTGLSTPWWIVTQERDGVAGLYRGWKAGVWGALGVWSLGLLATRENNREF